MISRGAAQTVSISFKTRIGDPVVLSGRNFGIAIGETNKI